jgi:hypothetical protein
MFAGQTVTFLLCVLKGVGGEEKFFWRSIILLGTGRGYLGVRGQRRRNNVILVIYCLRLQSYEQWGTERWTHKANFPISRIASTTDLVLLMLCLVVGRPEGRRPLGRPRRRWEHNIKLDLRKIGFGDVDWIHLAQDRDRWRALVNTVMNLRVP